MGCPRPGAPGCHQIRPSLFANLWLELKPDGAARAECEISGSVKLANLERLERQGCPVNLPVVWASGVSRGVLSLN